MGLDFDVLEFCKKLKQDRSPPYQCPLDKCDRVYKSLSGLQYHLVNYDHDNPTPLTPAVAPSRKKSGRARAPVPTGDIALQSPPKEALTFAEAQKVVQFEIDGKISRIAIDEPLSVISLEEWMKQNSELEKPFPFVEPVPEPHIKLPEASFKIIPDYNICDAPPRPNAYIRFIEKSVEELDGEVEYDVDEEDTVWLKIINEKRAKEKMPPVSVDTMELLMDRLEKESYFQSAQSGHHQPAATVDEDAVCCICMDGECQNTNVILFCDMCNLAVHQDCYGVPYIPEGQWLCRRCLQSPSRHVSCELCPNLGGALKQTDRGSWAHVICALWIPEVRFANTVFLEPIDSIESIPSARWRLSCYVCKQRGNGACIQCHRNNCYSAFHVTCAQHAGLYMKMDTVTPGGRVGQTGGSTGSDPSQPVHVSKIAYCDSHTPPNVLQERRAQAAKSSGLEEDIAGNNTAARAALFAARLAARKQGREKMKQARRMLAMKRTSAPIVLVPTLPPERVSEIAAMAGLGGTGVNASNAHLVKKLLAYWTLKRHHRNGAPLLRRLQSLANVFNSGRSTLQEGAVDTRELCNQLKYWQRIRQDLERARLLCELVRKRERLKASLTREMERELMHQLQPFQACLKKLLILLRSKDTADIFGEPVDPTEVPDYSSVVTHPMDFSTMSSKLDAGQYSTLEELESDFMLMISNCLAYNSKDTIFYKAGVKMRDQGNSLLRHARRDLKEAGFLDASTHIPDEDEPLIPPTPKRGKIRHSTHTAEVTTPKEKKIKKTDDPELELDNNNTRSGRRGRSVSRKIAESTPKIKNDSPVKPDTTELSKDRETPAREVPRLATPPAEKTPVKVSPFAKTTPETSPLGVNRRTSVLFTRKAQAAAALMATPPKVTTQQTLSPGISNITTTPTGSIFTESSINISSAPPKKKGRGRPKKIPRADKSLVDVPGVGPSGSVPASFLEYRGPRGEAGSDSDAPRSRSTSSSSASSCSSCTHSDDDHDDAMSSLESEGSSYNETMDSTTNQTMSDTDLPLARTASKLLSRGQTKSRHRTESMRQWSTDQSESEMGPPSAGKTRGRGRSSKSGSRGRKSSGRSGLTHLDLEPLQLVWAKCRGYPWYPALIIDPKMPKGYVHNGIPLPVPPQDVLNLKKNYQNEPLLFLVLFFDAKRTWQWLPPNKLEPLGLEKAVDQSKMTESRKPTERKAVKKAFSDAMMYKSQVSENSDVEKK